MPMPWNTSGAATSSQATRSSVAMVALRCLNVIVPTLSPAFTSPLTSSNSSDWLTLPFRSNMRTDASGSESVAFTVLSIHSVCGTSATTGTSDVWPPAVMEVVWALLASG